MKMKQSKANIKMISWKNNFKKFVSQENKIEKL